MTAHHSVFIPAGGSRLGTARLLVINQLGRQEPVLDGETGRTALYRSTAVAERAGTFILKARLMSMGVQIQ